VIEFNILTAFFQGLPETTAMTAVVYALTGLRFEWKSIFAIGLLQVITIYLVRLLPITFGIHIFLGIFTLAIYVYMFQKGSFLPVIKSSILTYLMLIVLEKAINTPILHMLNLSAVEACQNLPLWILLGWPQVIVIFVIALLINRHNLQKGRAADGRTESA
jgi:hypothetical protein